MAISNIKKEKANNSPLKAFKEKLDAEFACLVEFLDVSSMGNKKDHSKTSAIDEQRLVKLEEEVAKLKQLSLSKPEENKDVLKRCRSLENALCEKEAELKTCVDCIEKLKVVLAENEKQFESLKESKVFESSAKASLQKQLEVRCKQYDDITIQNKTMTQDLEDSLRSLTLAEKLVSKLSKEKEEWKQQTASNEEKINSLQTDLHRLKDRASTIDQNSQAKFDLLQQQLSITVKELDVKNNRMLDLEEQNGASLAQISSLKDEVECLIQEKEELVKLLEEVNESKQLEEKYKKTVDELKNEKEKLKCFQL